MASDAGAVPNDRRDRLQFLGINANDIAALQSLRPIFEQHSRAFADRFYDHLLADPHTAALLNRPGLLDRLKQLQAAYFADLLEGRFDEAYFAGRTRVGMAHQRVGLEPQWYLGAYNQYIQITFPLFAEALGHDFIRAMPALLALVKVVFLDIGLALDTYFDRATQQLRERNAELQHALSLYWRSQRREEQLRHVTNHEIRGGLAAVITHLDDLMDQIAHEPCSPEEINRQLSQISGRAWGLSNLLKEMLTQSDPGGPTRVAMGPVLEHLRHRFGLYSQGRKITLQLPRDEPPAVWADPIQLREIFANLLANSVRYMDKDEGRVAIHYRIDGEFIRFEVMDDGPGLPEQLRPRLFQPFVRGPGSHQPTNGTGLGLYFVRSMVEQNRGQIGIESTPGGGLLVWFTIPLTASPEPALTPTREGLR